MIAALTLLGVLSAIGAWLINNLSTAFVIALVGYLVYLERTYGPRFIGWAIALANQALHLHLTQVEQQATAGLVERTVLAAQQSITLPADRRASVMQAVAQIFPAASEAHVDSLIDATIATAKLQHGPEAWRGLAPASPTTAGPDDVTTLVRDAFTAGQQAVLSSLDALRAQAASAPSAPPVAPLPPTDEAMTRATAAVSVSGTLHTTEDGPVHLQGTITPAVATQATA